MIGGENGFLVVEVEDLGEDSVGMGARSSMNLDPLVEIRDSVLRVVGLDGDVTGEKGFEVVGEDTRGREGEMGGVSSACDPKVGDGNSNTESG